MKRKKNLVIWMDGLDGWMGLHRERERERARANSVVAFRCKLREDMGGACMMSFRTSLGVRAGSVRRCSRTKF